MQGIDRVAGSRMAEAGHEQGAFCHSPAHLLYERICQVSEQRRKTGIHDAQQVRLWPNPIRSLHLLG